MKVVKAKVKAYIINAAKCYAENGEIFTEDLPEYRTTAKVTDKNAAKLYKINSGVNINPGEILLIKSIDFVETVYTMPVEKFMEIATVEGAENDPEMDE